MNTITLAMARAFFACAWADLKEEQGISFGGAEIMDVNALKLDIKRTIELRLLYAGVKP